MPETNELSLANFMVADRSAEMWADIAQDLELAVVSVDQEIVVIDPLGKLPMRLEFRDIRNKLKPFVADDGGHG